LIRNAAALASARDCVVFLFLVLETFGFIKYIRVFIENKNSF